MSSHYKGIHTYIAMSYYNYIDTFNIHMYNIGWPSSSTAWSTYIHHVPLKMKKESMIEIITAIMWTFLLLSLYPLLFFLSSSFPFLRFASLGFRFGSDRFGLVWFGFFCFDFILHFMSFIMCEQFVAGLRAVWFHVGRIYFH